MATDPTQIAERLLARWNGNASSDGLAQLLDATDGSATGIWKNDGTYLHLVAFNAVAAMPQDVRDAFCDATRCVSQEQDTLGIVRATLTRKPVNADVANRTGSLAGSAGWLARFGATQSLSAPVIVGGELVAVIAVSSANDIDIDSAAGILLCRVATEFGHLLT